MEFMTGCMGALKHGSAFSVVYLLCERPFDTQMQFIVDRSQFAIMPDVGVSGCSKARATLSHRSSTFCTPSRVVPASRTKDSSASHLQLHSLSSVSTFAFSLISCSTPFADETRK